MIKDVTPPFPLTLLKKKEFFTKNNLQFFKLIIPCFVLQVNCSNVNLSKTKKLFVESMKDNGRRFEALT